jgi:hypothetical protein
MAYPVARRVSFFSVWQTSLGLILDALYRRSLQRDLKGILDKKLITAEGATNQLVYRLIE